MKKFFLFTLLMLGFTPLFAQSEDDDEIFSSSQIVPKPKSYGLYVGPRLGMTMTTMTQPRECDLYDGVGIGLSGGAAVRLRLGNMSENSEGGTGLFAIGLDLKYKQNRVKTIGSDNLSLSYFEVPVVAQIYPLYKNVALNGFYIEVGVDLAGTLSKSPDILTVFPNNLRYTQVAYHAGELKGFDCRIPIGVGYTFLPGFDVNLRYYIGTSNLAKNMACKMSSLEISLAWLFKVVK